MRKDQDKTEILKHKDLPNFWAFYKLIISKKNTTTNNGAKDNERYKNT